MATKEAYKRLKKEVAALKKSPPPYIDAMPLESNILEWHYVVLGPPGTPYEGGLYHGKLRFPPEYPFKPPSIYMITPNGRFKTNTRLCLSISDFHPQSWKPIWSVSSILTGLLSFMLEDTPTTGSIESTLSAKKILAEKSWKTNLEDPIFREVFPNLCTEMESGKLSSLVPKNGDEEIKPVTNSTLAKSSATTNTNTNATGNLISIPAASAIPDLPDSELKYTMPDPNKTNIPLPPVYGHPLRDFLLILAIALVMYYLYRLLPAAVESPAITQDL